MAKPRMFTGTLNENAVLNGLYNMIIGQEVFSDNIKLAGTLVEKFRLDGTLYGDTKLFMSSDIGSLYDFPDTSTTLLSENHPADPKVQAVSIDTFKQTMITVDTIKLKQAFASADIYGNFVSVVVQWLRDTYKVLNVTMINSFVGTTITEANKGLITLDYPTSDGVENLDVNQSKVRLAGMLGKEIADIFVDLNDAMRDYNEYGYMRAYNTNDFMIVWNKKYFNELRHIALPQIFHKGDVLDFKIEEHVINDRYFGKVYDDEGISVTVVDGREDGDTEDYSLIRLLEPMRVYDEDTNSWSQYFPGDVAPDGEYDASKIYINYGILSGAKQNTVCKIIHKRSIPFMSALLTQTEFWNPKEHHRNHYLTWGYSTPTYLREFPIITIEINEPVNVGE